MKDLYVDTVVRVYWECKSCDVRGGSAPDDIRCWNCRNTDLRVVAEDMERRYIDPGKSIYSWRATRPGETDYWV